MSWKKQQINLQINQMADCGLIVIAFWLSHTLRSHLTGFFSLQPIPEFANFFWLMAVLVPCTPLILEYHGYYQYPLEKTVGKSLKQMLRALLTIGLIVGICVVFFKWGAQSRLVLIFLTIIGGGLLLVKEEVIKLYLKSRAKNKDLKERVLVAGAPEGRDELINNFSDQQKAEIDIVDQFDISAQPLEDLSQSLHEKAVEKVIFTTGRVYLSKIEKAIHICETEGVEAWLSADFIETSITEPKFERMEGKPMLVFRSTPEPSWELLFKNIIDRVGALFLILCSLPLWLCAAIGIRLSTKGPILFKQKRAGHYGKPFFMYKFRTMELGAEGKRHLLERQNEMSGPVFKVENDPRIFKYGAFLRKTSIDELPQLINVLLGHMSLVGPRPLPVYEVNKIEYSAQRRRLSVKPGITCIWQVQGRNKIKSFDDWVKLDLDYIDNWSLWLDIKILLKTIPSVLLGAGAK